MFNFSLFQSDTPGRNRQLMNNNDDITHCRRHRLSSLLAIGLLTTSVLTGCQQQSTSESSAKTDEQPTLEAEQVAPRSDSAAAHIKQLQPIYVKQMQSLQSRLQAEYESLQAADMVTDSDDLLLNTEVDTDEIDVDELQNVTNAPDSESIAANNESDSLIDNNVNGEANIDTEADLNDSTEVGERDLTVLRRISAEPREPTILSEKQIIDSYQQTIDALYQPPSQPLDSEETNTLINIASLIPQLFEHTELADRLNAKSPALARLIVQHQVWEQIEARQASYMQEMKLAQQQEFESLMAKFNETIKDYDEQIAKYERTLKEFE